MNYTIGRLAKAADVHVETVRYYQRRGLLSAPARTTGFRHYTDADVEQLRFIKRAQSIGFTLSEVDTLLALRAKPSCPDTRALAARKLALVEERLRELRRLRRELTAWIDQCDHNPVTAPCPSMERLSA